jgi:5'-phosphate synthase pdxT subunit
MAIVGVDLFPVLREWVKAGKPIWGTCAGMILLSDAAAMQQIGGQALIGGLDVRVCRNFFGSQIHSCEFVLDASLADGKYKDLFPCSAVFIRAPAILQVGEGVDVIATVRAKPHPSARKEVLSSMNLPEDSDADLSVTVAVQQGNILATAFHPELTIDVRWHR